MPSSSPPPAVRPLDAAAFTAALPRLADILVACVRDGASVHFRPDVTPADALRFWQGLGPDIAAGRTLAFAGRVGGGPADRIDGVVLLFLVGAPNQPHRAEIGKMLVDPPARRQGLAHALLAAAEAEAARRGRWHLVLDTAAGSTAEALYRARGWHRFGLAPDFAEGPDGRLVASAFFCRDLRPNAAVTVAAETPDQPEIAALLAASDAYSEALYPAESNHHLPLAALMAKGVRFFVARQAGRAIGCGGFEAQGRGRGELKRFFVAEAARGRGAGAALIAAVEAAARADGVRRMRLETGVYSAPALALYRRAGYRPRPAFAPYRPDPLSVFMEKAL